MTSACESPTWTSSPLGWGEPAEHVLGRGEPLPQVVVGDEPRVEGAGEGGQQLAVVGRRMLEVTAVGRELGPHHDVEALGALRRHDVHPGQMTQPAGQRQLTQGDVDP
jgi:hypothetical protein